MPKFRKKPVVIEAWQYDPKVLFPPFLQDAYVKEDVAFDGGDLAIKTLEGTMFAKLGDWIIRGVAGELYPIKNEIFLETYEAVDAA